MPETVPKCVQTCFEHVLGRFFRKFFLPIVPRRVELSKIFKKVKNFSNLQQSLKSFPKVFKRVLDMFWVIFSKIFFAQCSMEGRVFENFQNSKNAHNRSQKCRNVF